MNPSTSTLTSRFAARLAVAMCLAATASGCGEGAPEVEAASVPVAPSSQGRVIEAERQSLQALMNQLGADAPKLSPGTELSIAVRDLTTGATASFQGDEVHAAGSAAKAIWVAAALHALGIGPVASNAEAIFRSSDSASTTQLLSLTGGRRVQGFYETARLSHSAFGLEGFDDAGTQTPAGEALEGNTTLTALDAVRFLTDLDAGALLSSQETAAMRAWMRLSPRTGFGGWLGTKLPRDARASLMHKAGGQPQGALHALSDLGIVQVPHGHRYAIAVFARRGANFWGAQIPFVESASAQVYKLMADLSGPAKPLVEP